MSQITHNTLGSAFKALREKKGLSQESVAKAAGIGRSTLVHLENGADVRLSKINAVASVLGTGLEAATESKEITERRQARMQQSLRTLSLQKAHWRLALDLLLEDPAAVTAIADARRMVDLWQREKTCSAFYIDTWRTLLAGTPREVGTALARMDPQWESALLQNSPFGARLGLAA